MPTEQLKTYRILLVASVLLAAILLLWGLGSIPLLSYNEARRALSTASMFTSGDWLLPRLNGELYLTKPPLFYWLEASASLVAGSVNEWTLRLPSAMAAAVTAILAYRFAHRHFGIWAALFTLQLLLANASFALFARRAEIEMLLATLCFASLLAALHYVLEEGRRYWLWLSYFLLGLGVLTKGPLVLIFVTLPLLVLAFFRRDTRTWQALRDPLGWLIFVAVGGSWFFAVTWQEGMDIWRTTVRHDMLAKMYGHAGEPFYNYFLWYLSDFFPASLLLFVAPVATWRRWRQASTTLLPVVLAIALPFVLYTLFSDKHAKYLLPTYPWIAILLGKRLAEVCEAVQARWQRVLMALSFLLLAGYGAFYAVAEARVFDYRYVALQGFQTWHQAHRELPLYGYRHLDERLLYYAGQNIPLLDDAALQQLSKRGTSAYLLVEHDAKAAPALSVNCTIVEFNPYLKSRKALTVYGLGTACPAAQGTS
ncbi:MAG TPA: glycosyltransferase family 39 protein [Methylophilaceae bacterium]|nr:glycosyltransferase family 39 protein [Methylophilaceae bacterium]